MNKARFKNKETSVIYQYIGSVYRKGHLKFILRNTITNDDILVSSQKLNINYEKLN